MSGVCSEGDAIFDKIANDLILGIQTVLLNSPLNAVEVSKHKRWLCPLYMRSIA